MSTWTATIEDKDTRVLAYCTTLGNAQLVFPLNAPSTFSTSFASTGLDTQAILTQLASGSVFVRVMENGTSRFWGQLSDMQLNASDTADLTATFTDVAGTLANVNTLYHVSDFGSAWDNHGWCRTFSGTHSFIIDYLLDIYFHSGVGPHYGPLVKGTRSGSVSTSRTILTDASSLLEVLTGLSDLANGIEWWMTPDATLNIATVAGDVNKYLSVTFEYGPTGRANVQSLTSQYLPPRNLIWVRDDTNHYVSGGYDRASIDAYGEYSQVVQKVKRGGETNTDIGDARLRTKWRQILDVTLEPTVCPRPWTDFNLGDTIALNLTRDVWSYSGNQRVNQITFDFDEQLVETGITTQFEVI